MHYCESIQELGIEVSAVNALKYRLATDSFAKRYDQGLNFHRPHTETMNEYAMLPSFFRLDMAMQSCNAVHLHSNGMLRLVLVLLLLHYSMGQLIRCSCSHSAGFALMAGHCNLT